MVYPTFEPLDAFGPVEALQMLAWNIKKLDLCIIGPTLDLVSTSSSDPEWNKTGSRFGVSIQPTHTYADPPADLDVLFVPGGGGAHGEEAAVPMVEFIRKTYPKLKYLITICTGASLAARAGVLDGKRATTNKMMWKSIADASPGVQWIRTARFVVDGNCWTSSGVSAGIDVTLGWIRAVFGHKEARRVADVME